MIYIEVPVPVWVASEFGVSRVWKPDNHRDYRLIFSEDGRWYIFPNIYLYSDEFKAQIELKKQIEIETSLDKSS